MSTDPLRLEAPLAIVDLETTGGSPARHRITEVAVIEVDGWRVSSQWSTLVNPETAIPADIQALTGITNDMVAGAPRFAALARELHERLGGRVFVAHNARFDYGFLRSEFERTGRSFDPPTLCTVRLSRRLYRDQGGHSLDALIERHGIDCRARHRALGDADALWQFLRIAAAEHGDEVLAVAARQALHQVVLPPRLERSMIEAIPEAPGAYLLYGEGPAPLYVGNGINLHARVLSHFSAYPRTEKAARLAREVTRIEWQRTAGELGARLREASLVRTLGPALNRSSRRRDAGPGEEPAWPHRTPLGIVERDARGERSEVHVVDRWRYLGTACSEADIGELLDGRASAPFDPEHYRILERHLGRRRARVVELAA
jgi:DNA polymerase-3 subunit epsilon